MTVEEFKENAIKLLTFLLEISKESAKTKGLENDIAYKNYHQGLEDAIKMIETLGFH